ncbi:MATE family efflux transporter [Halorussus salilacus]|uniref:MATE family efflux transporter n=1 Tax=Halorussus salilacus TaxID=2953750 RepID=UPI0020A0B84F|nr:MATE family efflux transporter [Halorussus salilacus]USZ66773.1 MATE family efflux transporter [Halorussus salilacus]
MFDDAKRRARSVAFLFPAALARLGLLDREKGEEAFDLAVPVMVTGGMRTLLRVADFFMVGRALGDEAVAALELGFQYFFIPFGLSLGLTSGTISVVSRFEGAGERASANFAVKQSLWLALAMAIPITAATWVYAEPMIAFLTDDPRTIELGAVYLRIIMLSVSFRFWSMIAARALAGVGDTRTPMYIRLLTLPTNIGLNAVLIFGFGPFPELGVAGAAWGTAVANTLAAVLFTGALLSGRYAIRLPLGGKQWDWSIAAEIVRVGLPLAGTRLARTFGRFPFLLVLTTLGTPVVAAYAIGRRVMLLALMPAWGYSTASSTLVGQSIGAGNDEAADEYGWQTLRIALATQLCIAAVLVAAARPLAVSFGTEHVGLTVEFIRVFGIGVAAFSVSRTMRGGLRGAGDTRWPFYGTVAGSYLFKLPVAFLAVAPGAVLFSVGGWNFAPGLGLGLLAVYVAIVGDMYIRAVVNVFRFWTGEWKRVARESGVGAGTGAD